MYIQIRAYTHIVTCQKKTQKKGAIALQYMVCIAEE